MESTGEPKYSIVVPAFIPIQQVERLAEQELAGGPVDEPRYTCFYWSPGESASAILTSLGVEFVQGHEGVNIVKDSFDKLLTDLAWNKGSARVKCVEVSEMVVQGVQALKAVFAYIPALQIQPQPKPKPQKRKTVKHESGESGDEDVEGEGDGSGISHETHQKKAQLAAQYCAQEPSTGNFYLKKGREIGGESCGSRSFCTICFAGYNSQAFRRDLFEEALAQLREFMKGVGEDWKKAGRLLTKHLADCNSNLRKQSTGPWADRRREEAAKWAATWATNVPDITPHPEANRNPTQHPQPQAPVGIIAILQGTILQIMLVLQVLPTASAIPPRLYQHLAVGRGTSPASLINFAAHTGIKPSYTGLKGPTQEIQAPQHEGQQMGNVEDAGEDLGTTGLLAAPENMAAYQAKLLSNVRTSKGLGGQVAHQQLIPPSGRRNDDDGEMVSKKPASKASGRNPKKPRGNEETSCEDEDSSPAKASKKGKRGGPRAKGKKIGNKAQGKHKRSKKQKQTSSDTGTSSEDKSNDSDSEDSRPLTTLM